MPRKVYIVTTIFETDAEDAAAASVIDHMVVQLETLADEHGAHVELLSQKVLTEEVPR